LDETRRRRRIVRKIEAEKLREFATEVAKEKAQALIVKGWRSG
jgi:hypothetical protein